VNYDRTASTGNSPNRATANKRRWRSLSIRRIAARFLAELAEEQQAENVWIEDIRTKIDAAISVSEQTPPIDGETFVNQILERFQRDSEALP
jgi:antitoxin ParD1/3/4